MISIVNGYVCTSSCEAATARAGKDPHAPPGTPPGVSAEHDKNGLADRPATVLGGALASIEATAPTNEATAPLLNRLA